MFYKCGYYQNILKAIGIFVYYIKIENDSVMNVVCSTNVLFV